MTSNVKAHPGKNMRGAPEPPDVLLPPLDRAEASVKDLLRNAKKRGYVTVEQVSSALPSKVGNSEQTKDILSIFGEMGVNVVETQEAAPEDDAATSTSAPWF
jgi:RNA polymerase primary sigma factor